MKSRTVSERVTKDFLLDLLAPFHPTLKSDEKIVSIFLKEDGNAFIIKYEIVKGGVKNS